MHRVRLRSFRQFGVVVLFVSGANCHAIGLGAISLQSALGQPLVANVPLLGDGRLTTAANCVRARIESIDGVLLAPVQVSLVHNDLESSIRLATAVKIDEPAVAVALDLTCAQAVKRSYQVLLDPVLITNPVAATTLPIPSQPLRVPLPGTPGSPYPVRPKASNGTGAPAAAPSPASARTPEQIQRAKAAREARARRADEARERRQAAAANKASRAAPELTRVAVTGAAAQNSHRISAERGAAPVAPTESRATLRLTTSDVLSDAAPRRGTAAAGAGGATAAGAAAAGAEQLDRIGADALSAESRMAAMAQENEAKMRSMLAEVQTLRQATERIRQQAQADKAALEVERAERANSLPMTWFFLVGGLLLLALLAIGYLLWRRRNEQSMYRSSWDDIIAETEATPVKPPREPSNLAPEQDIAVPFFDIPAAAPAIPVEESPRPAIKPVVRFDEPEEFEVPQRTPEQISEAEEIERLVQRVYQVPAEPVSTTSATSVTSEPQAEPAAVPEMPAMDFKFDEDPPAAEPAELPALSFYDVDLTNGEPAQIDPEEFVPLPYSAEVSSAVQEAETWMSEHNPRKAMEIFERFMVPGEPLLAAPTLYLLDLYRLTSEDEKYADLQARAEQQFRLSAPPVAVESSGDDLGFPSIDDHGVGVNAHAGRGLEGYPDIQKAINTLWHDDHIIIYLENLLIKYREGFDLSVYREIAWTISLARERVDQ